MAGADDLFADLPAPGEAEAHDAPGRADPYERARKAVGYDLFEGLDLPKVAPPPPPSLGERALGAYHKVMDVVGLPKRAIDYGARGIGTGLDYLGKPLGAKPLNIEDAGDLAFRAATGDLSGESLKKTREMGSEFLDSTGHPDAARLWAAGNKVAETAGRNVGNILTDPAMYLLPGAGPMAKVAGAAFLPGMVEGAYRGGQRAIEEYHKAGDRITPESAEAATEAAISGGMGLLTGAHLLGGRPASAESATAPLGRYAPPPEGAAPGPPGPPPEPPPGPFDHAAFARAYAAWKARADAWRARGLAPGPIPGGPSALGPEQPIEGEIVPQRAIEGYVPGGGALPEFAGLGAVEDLRMDQGGPPRLVGPPPPAGPLVTGSPAAIEAGLAGGPGEGVAIQPTPFRPRRPSEARPVAPPAENLFADIQPPPSEAMFADLPKPGEATPVQAEPIAPAEPATPPPSTVTLDGKPLSEHSTEELLLQRRGALQADQTQPGTNTLFREIDRELIRRLKAKQQAAADVPPQVLAAVAPTPEPATMRLYRVELPPGAETKGAPEWVKGHGIYERSKEAMGRWFTDDPAEAQWYLDDQPGAHVTALDVPSEEAEQYRVSNLPEQAGGKETANNPRAFSRRPEKEFFLPPEVAARRLPTPFADQKAAQEHGQAIAARQTEALRPQEPPTPQQPPARPIRVEMPPAPAPRTFSEPPIRVPAPKARPEHIAAARARLEQELGPAPPSAEEHLAKLRESVRQGATGQGGIRSRPKQVVQIQTVPDPYGGEPKYRPLVDHDPMRDTENDVLDFPTSREAEEYLAKKGYEVTAPKEAEAQLASVEPTPTQEGRPTTYWRGDLAEYTGTTKVVAGGTFHELRLLEGSRKGKTVLTQTAPGGEGSFGQARAKPKAATPAELKDLMAEVEAMPDDGLPEFYNEAGRRRSVPELQALEQAGKVPRGTVQRFEDWWSESGGQIAAGKRIGGEDTEGQAAGVALGITYKGRPATRAEILKGGPAIKKRLLEKIRAEKKAEEQGHVNDWLSDLSEADFTAVEANLRRKGRAIIDLTAGDIDALAGMLAKRRTRGARQQPEPGEAGAQRDRGRVRAGDGEGGRRSALSEGGGPAGHVDVSEGRDSEDGEGGRVEARKAAYSAAGQLALDFGRPGSQRAVQSLSGGARLRGLEAGSGVRTVGLAVTIPKELQTRGWIDLRGRRVDKPSDLAVLAQVYRDPRYETFRIFYTKEGRIVAHEGLTSRVPDSVVVFDAKRRERDLHAIRERLRRTGADGYWLLHNHPSGQPKASQADVNITHAISLAVPGFRGHVIIDGDSFGSIELGEDKRGRFGSSTIRDLPKEIIDAEPYFKPSRVAESDEEKMTGMEGFGGIHSPRDLARLGAAFRSGTPADYVTLIHTDAPGFTRAIQEMPTKLFERRKDAEDFIRGQKRALGGSRTFAYYPAYPIEATGRVMEAAARHLVATGILDDAIIGRAMPSIVDRGGSRPSKSELKIPGRYRVAEDKKPIYEKTKLGDQALIPGALEAASKGKRRTEGREAEGPLFTQDKDKSEREIEKKEKEAQGSLFEEKEPYDPELTALHNLTPENLRKADSLGGLAMPSIAITRGKVHEGYGQITLVGTRQMIDPSGSPAQVYPGDVYSGRFPETEFKSKRGMADAFLAKVPRKEFHELGDEGYDKLRKSPDEAADYARHSLSMKAAFLRERGQKAAPVIRPVGLRHPEVAQDSQLQTWAKDQTDLHGLRPDSPEWTTFSDLVKGAIDRYEGAPDDSEFSYELREIQRGGLLDENGELFYGPASRIIDDLVNLKDKRTRLDRRETESVLDDAIRKLPSGAYEQWVREKVEPMFSGEFIRLGRQKVPVTLDSIVEAMHRTGVQATEKNMTYGPGQARATGLRPISSIEEMRNRKESIVPGREFASWKEGNSKLQDEMQTALLQHFKYDTWDGLNAMYKAVARSLKALDSTSLRIRRELMKEGFSNISDEAIKKTQAVIRSLREAPTEYFEAKPLRGVKLNEFAGAAIPDDAPSYVREILKKHGLRIEEYQTGTEERGRDAARQEAVDAILADSPDSVFEEKAPYRTGEEEPAPPFYSHLERAAAKIPQAMSGPDLTRFLAGKGVKADEMKWTGLDDFLKDKGKVTPQELRDFVAQNKVEVREVTLGADQDPKEAKAAFQAANDAAGDAQDKLYEALDDVRLSRSPDDRVGLFPAQLSASVARGEVFAMDGASAILGVTNGQHPLVQATYDAWSRSNALRNDTVEWAKTQTKFSQYQMPGGENYRELLLTLPALRGRFKAVGERLDEISNLPAAEHARRPELQQEWDRLMEEHRRLQPPSPFTGNHFDEPNVLAHVRFNDRTDSAGNKVLFLEELQSDWAQKGRRGGFDGERRVFEIWRGEELLRGGHSVRVFHILGSYSNRADAEAWLDRAKAATSSGARGLTIHETVSRKAGVPTAPFVGKTEAWTELALKRMLRYAAEHGYDKLAWTTGEQQAARYDLSKQVHSVGAFDRGDGFYDLMVRTKEGNRLHDLTKLSPSALADNVGKDLADKIVQQKPKEWQEYTGLDLKVGGEGMKGFYDKIVPAVAGKLGKKWGATVGETRITTGAIDRGENQKAQASFEGALGDAGLTNAQIDKISAGWDTGGREEALRLAPEAVQRYERSFGEASTVPVHSIDITPEMRASVTGEGFAVFEEKKPYGGVTPEVMPKPGRVVERGVMLSPADELARHGHVGSALVHEKGTKFTNVDIYIDGDGEPSFVARGMEGRPDEEIRGIKAQARRAYDQAIEGVRLPKRREPRIDAVRDVLRMAMDQIEARDKARPVPSQTLEVESTGGAPPQKPPDLPKQTTLFDGEGALNRLRASGGGKAHDLGSAAAAGAGVLKDTTIYGASVLERMARAAAGKIPEFGRWAREFLSGLSGIVKGLADRLRSLYNQAVTLFRGKTQGERAEAQGGARGARAAAPAAEAGAGGAQKPPKPPKPPSGKGQRDYVGGSPYGKPGPTGPTRYAESGIPFLITREMQAELRGKGFTQAEIDRMTPEAAWRELGRRVDQDVRKTRKAEGRAGIPHERLDRETARAWDTIDPEVKRVATEYTDEHFYEVMKRRQLDDAEVQAWTARVKGKEEQLYDARADLEEALRGTDEKATATARFKFAAQSMDYVAAMRALINDGTGTARALAARNRLMEAVKSGDEVLLHRIFKDIEGITDAQAADLIRILHEDPLALGEALNAAMKPGLFSKWLELWKAGLVSGPGTHVANTIGNIGEQIFRLGETGTAALIDALLPGKSERFSGEAKAEFFGAFQNLGPALRRLGADYSAMFRLKPEAINPRKGLEWQVPKIAGKFGRAVRIPFRGLEAMDNFFKVMGGHAELAKLAYREAAKGMVGASEARILEKAEQIRREAYNYEHPNYEKWTNLRRQVEQSKLDRTFQNEMPRWAKTVDIARSRHKWLHMVVPFLQTPSNIATVSIRRSPLGFIDAARAIKEFNRGEITKGQLADRMAGPVLGTAVMGLFIGLARAGMMTGSGPVDEDKKRLLRRTGWMPYSFVFPKAGGGHFYLPFNRFEPASSVLGFAADAVEAKDARTGEDLISKGVGSIVQNLLSKTYLTGLTDAAAATSRPSQFMGQYLKNVAGSVVPNIFAKAAQAIDPTVRDTKGTEPGIKGLPLSIGKTIMSRTPFLSQKLRPAASGTGENITRPGYWFERFASPAIHGETKDDSRLEQALIDADYVPSPPQRQITVPGTGGKSVLLTDEEYQKYVEADRKITERLRKLIADRKFQRLSPEGKKQFLESRYRLASADARRVVLPSAVRRYASENR